MARKARVLTREGIDRFRSYLAELREGSSADPPRDLLDDPAASAPFEPERMVDTSIPETRLEAARCLDSVFGGITGVEEHVGLWTWLSLLYFDVVCPRRPDGGRSPGRDYRHVLEPGYRAGHRHLLAGPFLVYHLHGEEGRLLLSSRLHRENVFHHELASRQVFISNPSIIRAASLLYLDRRKGTPRRGGADPKRGPGTLRRFVDLLQQMDVNYDLYSMDAEAILELLPEEFDSWKRRRGLLRNLTRRRAAKGDAR